MLNGKERFTSSPILRKFSFATHQNNLLFQDNIVHIREAKNGDIWVGTLDNGLYYLKRNPSTNDWNYQWINVQKGLSNNCIKAISEDTNNFIWVATNKGLNRIDPQTLSVKIYQLNDGLANNEFSERAYIEKGMELYILAALTVLPRLFLLCLRRILFFPNFLLSIFP